MKTYEEKLAYQRQYQRDNFIRAREIKCKWIAEHLEEWREYYRKKMKERYHTLAGEKARRKTYREQHADAMKAYNQMYYLREKLGRLLVGAVLFTLKDSKVA